MNLLKTDINRLGKWIGQTIGCFLTARNPSNKKLPNQFAAIHLLTKPAYCGIIYIVEKENELNQIVAEVRYA